ncbi:MAG TPA: hypothetical protein VN682_01230 [Terriglobales bacterium]|nr:hypothetical protein [Terriglobales bacterium]
MNNNGVSPNYCTIANENVTQHFRPRCNEDVIPDLWNSSSLASSADCYILRDEDIPPNFGLGMDHGSEPAIPQLESFPGIEFIRDITMKEQQD